MIKKTITYTDYNGTERTEDFYFNFTEAELMEMEYETDGGMSETIQRIIKSNDTAGLIRIFKDFVLKAYGEKTLDGKRFSKSKEISDSFASTEAYSIIFMELATDSKAASEFVNGLIPKRLAETSDQSKKYSVESHTNNNESTIANMTYIPPHME